MIDRLKAALLAQRFSCADEDELQFAVAAVLDAAGIAYEREYRVGARDRIDFLVDGSIALELKVHTSTKSLLRQVLRYAEHSFVTAVVVASTTHHARLLPETANSKPVHGLHLQGW